MKNLGKCVLKVAVVGGLVIGTIALIKKIAEEKKKPTVDEFEDFDELDYPTWDKVKCETNESKCSNESTVKEDNIPSPTVGKGMDFSNKAKIAEEAKESK